MNKAKLLCGGCVGGRKEQEGKKWECCLKVVGGAGARRRAPSDGPVREMAVQNLRCRWPRSVKKVHRGYL